MAEAEPRVAPPSGGRKPPAPPATGGPGRDAPDPFDHGSPIVVFVDSRPFGDLGHPLVDARLVSAVVHRGSEVAEWLVAFGVVAETDPEPWLQHGHVSLDRLSIGQIGHRHADARLVWAIAARERRLGRLTHEHVEAAFRGAAWL